MPLKALVAKAAQVYKLRPQGTRGHVFKDLLEVPEAKLEGEIHSLATADLNDKLTNSTITINFIRILNEVVLVARNQKKLSVAEIAIAELAAAGESAIKPRKGLAGLVGGLLGGVDEVPEIVTEYRAFITLVGENLKQIVAQAAEAKYPPPVKVSRSTSDVDLLVVTKREELEARYSVLRSTLRRAEKTKLEVTQQLSQVQTRLAEIEKAAEEAKDELPATKEIISDSVLAEISFQKLVREISIGSSDKEFKHVETIKAKLATAITTVLRVKESAVAIAFVEDCEKLKELIQAKFQEYKKAKLAANSDMSSSVFFSPVTPVVSLSDRNNGLTAFFESAFQIIEKLQLVKSGDLPVGLAPEKLDIYLFFAEKLHQQSKTHVPLSPRSRAHIHGLYISANY